MDLILDKSILNDFKPYMGNDGSGVLAAYLIDNIDLSMFRPKCAEYIKKEAMRTNNLAYVGESGRLKDRIDRDIKNGPLKNAALRRTIASIIDSRINKASEDVISNWIWKNLRFKIYLCSESERKILSKYLIDVINPIFNGGPSKFKEYEKRN